MAQPMFFYTGIYDSVADADAHYEAIQSLHRGKAIGSVGEAATARSTFTLHSRGSRRSP